MVRRLVVGIATIGCLLLAPAVGYASWSAPQRVSATGENLDEPRIVSDHAGDSVILWIRHLPKEREIVEAVTKPAGGAWSSAVGLGSGHPDPQPEVAIDSSGEATVVWTGSRRAGKRVLETTYARSHPAHGGWGPPVALSTSNIRTNEGRVGEAQIALDRRGDATVVFDARSRDGKEMVQFSIRPRGGRWSAPRTSAVAAKDGSVGQPQVAMDDRGETLIAWSAFEQIQVVMLGRGGRPLGATQTVGEIGGYPLRLTANAKGDALLTWAPEATGGSPVEISTRRAGGRFTGAVNITPAAWRSRPAVTAIDEDGNATVLFTRNGAGDRGFGAHEIVQIADHPAGGHWSKPRPLPGAIPPNGLWSEEPAITLGPDGEMISAWVVLTPESGEPGGSESLRIEASVRPTGSQWQPPTLVAFNGAYAPVLAFSTSTTVTAAWIHHEAASSFIETDTYQLG